MKQTLKNHIKSQGRTFSWVAEQIGISQPLFSMKLNGTTTLDQDTKTKACDILGIDLNDVL